MSFFTTDYEENLNTLSSASKKKAQQNDDLNGTDLKSVKEQDEELKIRKGLIAK
jgi:hypothetical protein